MHFANFCVTVKVEVFLGGDEMPFWNRDINDDITNYDEKSQKKIKRFRQQKLKEFKQQAKKETPHFAKFLKHNLDNDKAQQALIDQKREIDKRNQIRKQAATLLTNIGQANFNQNSASNQAPQNEQNVSEETDSTISSNFTVMIGMLNGLLEENEWLSDEIINNQLKLEQYPVIINELLRFNELYREYCNSIKIKNEN